MNSFVAQLSKLVALSRRFRTLASPVTAVAAITIAFVIIAANQTALGATHPYHVSLTEIEFNQKSGNFEVAMCVWPADIEKALSKAAGSSVNLDETTKLDELLESYFEKRVKLQDTNKNAATVRWVGHEHEKKKFWVYFELSFGETMVDSKAEFQFSNRAFFELNDDQANQVNVYEDGRIASHSCTTAKATHWLKFTKP